MSNKNQRRVQVTSGAKGAASADRPDKTEQEIIVDEARALKPQRDGEVVYQSKAVNFRLQITAPAKRYDPSTGLTEEQKPKVAQFSGGVFRTSDPEVIARLEVRGDRPAPGYGVNRDYWRVEDMVEVRRVADTEEFAAKLAADPELFERVQARLSASGFQLPAPPKSPSDEDGQ